MAIQPVATVDATTKHAALGDWSPRGAGAVARRLLRVVGALPAADHDALRELTIAFERDVCPALDYETLAGTFAARYLLVNYWKSVLALSEILSGKDFGAAPLRVVDVGAGSGAATLAMLALVNELALASAPVEVTLVDRSEAQLALALQMIDAVQGSLPRLELTLRPVALDIADNSAWRGLLGDTDYVLAAHVLTENYASADRILLAMLSAVGPGTQTVLIERDDDAVWDKIASATEQAALPRVMHRLHAPAKGLPMGSGFDWPRADSLATRSARWCSPPDPRLPATVRGYFRAWSSQAPSLLDEIFTDDAEYLERPFTTPLRGVESIRSYWHDIVGRQSAPQPRILEIAYSGNTALLEWSTEISGPGARKTVTGAMVLTFDPASAKIRELREYFTSSDTAAGR